MNARFILGLCVLIVIGGIVYYLNQSGRSRRLATKALTALNESLSSNDAGRLLQAVVLPNALRIGTPAEQFEFLVKSLRDEIAAEGITALNREAAFGPLTNLFPAEAEAWAGQAGVPPENCLAFRMEKNGLRAEVVILSSESGYRIIRCNNVKQMADTKP